MKSYKSTRMQNCRLSSPCLSKTLFTKRLPCFISSVMHALDGRLIWSSSTLSLASKCSSNGWSWKSEEERRGKCKKCRLAHAAHFRLITSGILWKCQGLTEGAQTGNSARPRCPSTLPWFVPGEEVDEKEGDVLRLQSSSDRNLRVNSSTRLLSI